MLIQEDILSKMKQHFPKWMDIRRKVTSSGSLLLETLASETSEIKNAIEDYKKYVYDKSYNNSTSLCYDVNDSEFKEVHWKDITLGQIIKVNQDTEIPADLLIIKSSSENGFCYLKTSNLDGETNLKPREAINYFQNNIKSTQDLQFKGSIEIDSPNKNIYCIGGCIIKENQEKIYFDI